MSDEVELKLTLSPEDADALEGSDLPTGGKMRAEQSSIYFDTPDHDLARAGMSLRIRRSGSQRIETVKAAGGRSAGLFARPEWEQPVSDDRPVLDDTTPIPGLLGDRVAEIAPLFEIRIERRTWEIRQGEAIIEMALDRGAAIASDRRSPICEAELELKEGEPAALFALARRLQTIVPVRLGVLSKSERGYALIGPVATVFKAEPVALGSQMTAAEAFQRILQACLRQFRLNENLLLDGRRPEALHQARVALRRLRSAFTIFKSLLDGDPAARRLRDELRWLASELGKARDLDVLLERAPAGPLHDRLEGARAGAYQQVEEALASPRVRTLMLDLAEWTSTGDWLSSQTAKAVRDQPARRYAAEALDRLRRKVKKGGRDLAGASDEARHEVRKSAKKLRYAAEFFAGLFEDKRERRRHRRFLAALEALQDDLGALNDLATAPEALDKLELGDQPGADALLSPADRKTLVERAEENWAELIDAKRFWR